MSIVVPPDLEDRIRRRAHEIWQYRQEFDVQFIVEGSGQEREITAQDDWLEAEQDIKEGN